MVQKKYWEDLIQLRFQLFYLEEYLCQSYRYNSWVNISMAIASSSSIAAWAIWDKFNFLWSLIIAISQVINAVKIYLPFNKRTKYINLLYSQLTELFNEYDYNWLNVANGVLTEEEINNLIYKFRKKKHKIHDEHLLNNHLPQKKKLKELADVKLKNYFENYSN